MEQGGKKISKPMFWIGLVMILISATALITTKEDLGAWPMVMSIIGILSMGFSNYRPMK